MIMYGLTIVNTDPEIATDDHISKTTIFATESLRNQAAIDEYKTRSLDLLCEDMIDRNLMPRRLGEKQALSRLTAGKPLVIQCKEFHINIEPFTLNIEP